MPCLVHPASSQAQDKESLMSKASVLTTVPHHRDAVQVILEVVLTCVHRILGTRVSELEKKLKTLEMTGFWNTTGILTSLRGDICETTT